MKKLLFIAAIALLATSIKVNSQNADNRYEAFGVAFYNLENLFDTINSNGTYDLEFSPKGAKQWDGKKYWSKQANMAYAISQLTTKSTPGGPAVIGVSEIENITVLQDLVKQESIRRWHLQIVHHDSPDRRGVDVGLLYNPRMFRVLNVTNTPLIIPDNPTFRTRDQMCVTGLLGGEKVSIIVGHWPSRLGGQEQSSYLREAAAALAKHIADSVLRVDPNQGIIIMGDLNDDPNDKSCAEVLGACRNKKDVKDGGFFNPWWETLDKGVGSLAYDGAWNLFDQIIISDYFLRSNREHLTYLNHYVHNFEFLRTKEGTRKGYPLRTFSSGAFLNGYSDHFPTQIIFARKVK